jgi:lysine biosynthesis protein LysW
MPTSICPECHEEVYVDAESEQGDGVSCDECGARLTIVGLDPIELDLKDDTDADELSHRDDFDSYDFDDHHH